MKKVISVVGARPNFMKVAPIHFALQKYKDKIAHYIVHTGQHYDYIMSQAFFQDLEMPEPNYYLDVGSGTHAEQTAKVMIGFEKVLIELKPDLVIVVGDVNSTIAAALTAVKLGVKVAHVEAGLRSYDREMPEEINRIATDSICNYCFVTEQSGFDNLVKENFPESKIFFVGNTMIDSQVFGLKKAENSNILEKLQLDEKKYILVTLHRPSNVDIPSQLEMFLKLFAEIPKYYKVVFPAHPRTLKNIAQFGLKELVSSNPNLKLLEPMGYIDFLALMQKSKFVMTDSGGIQEETTAIGVPCLTVRTTTERPITCEIGTNVLVKPEYKPIIDGIDLILNRWNKKAERPPLWDGKAAERIAVIISEKLL